MDSKVATALLRNARAIRSHAVLFPASVGDSDLIKDINDTVDEIEDILIQRIPEDERPESVFNAKDQVNEILAKILEAHKKIIAKSGSDDPLFALYRSMYRRVLELSETIDA